MRSDIQIIPAILATSEEEYRQNLRKLEACPEFIEGWVHIDLMDNKFVQNKSVGLDVVKKYPTKFLKEAHLMVADPINWVDELIEADIARVIFHLETGNVDQVIQVIKSKKGEVGLAVSPETDINTLKPYLNKIDLILMMGVHPGSSGQKFIPATMEKIKKVKEYVNEQVIVGVDGGIDEESVKLVVSAGASHIVIGSHLLQGDVQQNLEYIWQALRN